MRAHARPAVGRFVRVIQALTALIMIALVAVTIVVHTDRFQNFLRLKVTSYLNETYRGKYTIGSVTGSVLGNLTLSEVRVSYKDSSVLFIPSVQLQYQLLPILGGRVNITRLIIEAPVLHL